MLDEGKTYFYHGYSMRDTFRPGDCLTIVPVSLDNVLPGDVVIYRGTDHRGAEGEVVHRVIAIAPYGLVTQGDNCLFPDRNLVTRDNLMGKVTHVERKGRTRLVRGGRLGLLRSRFLHAWNYVWRRVWRTAVRIGHRPYRWLRESNFASFLWRPSITKICLETENGPLIKYIWVTRTVARWWPQQNRFECRKPFDLFIPRPDGLE